MNAANSDFKAASSPTGRDGGDRVARGLGAILLAMALTLTTLDLSRAPEELQFTVDWQTILRLALCGMCGLFGLIYLPRTVHRFQVFPAFWLLPFVAWACVSTVFGIAPSYSAASVVALVCMIVFAPAILEVLGKRGTTLTIICALLGYILISWFLFWAFPSLGRSPFEMPDNRIIYRVGGDAQQLGFQAAWVGGFLLLLGLDGSARWSRLIVPLALAYATIPFTQSRTAALASVAVAGVVFLPRARWTTLSLGACAGVAAITLAVLLSEMGWLGDAEMAARKVSRSGEAEEIYNLTGRTAVWEHALLKISMRPLLGWGYGASRQAIGAYPQADFGDFEPLHAHNQVINTALCVGIVGAGLLAAMFLGLLVTCLRRPDPVVGMALAFVFVAGITEPVLFGPMPRSHTVIWLLAMFWPQYQPTTCLSFAQSADLQARVGEDSPNYGGPAELT